MLAPSGAVSVCTYIWIPLPSSPAACVTTGLSLGYNYPQLSLFCAFCTFPTAIYSSFFAAKTLTFLHQVSVPLTALLLLHCRRS
jgi:hypothetical protein